MECEVCTENGRGTVETTSKTIWQLERDSRVVSGSFVLDFAAHVPRELSQQEMYVDLVPPQPPSSSSRTSELPVLDLPFMSSMDEITYWIYTKRAPCLLNYDILAKKQQQEEAHCSKTKPKSVASIHEDIISPKKKKKRKLTILDDDSVSEKQQNVYFDVSNQQNHKTELSSCKSEPVSSDVDFNIKSASMKIKRKRLKLQKNSHTILHNKNKVVTSTPKDTKALRRSSRKARQNLNNNSHFNRSFEVYNCTIVNGNGSSPKKRPTKAVNRSKKVTEKLPEQVNNRKNESAEKSKNEVVINGQFEDMSDVSGFTANYIRSTKKTPRKLRGKTSRNLVKESQKSKDDTMVICVNKATNPELSKPALNCSTDSSQNIVNLVTMENTEKSTKVSRGTSVLKFMESKTNKETVSRSKVNNNQSRNNLNVSFQSSGTSRYPKRYKNVSTEEGLISNTPSKKSPVKRRYNKNCSDFNSDRKENPNETSVSKTRSGKILGLALHEPENSVLVFSNSTEQMSSAISMNVATPALKDNKKKRISQKCTRSTKIIDKCSQRTSLREKSGFSACFSDSEDDKPLRPQKFFC